MEEEKTTLQKIVEQKAEQIKIAIKQVMDEGAWVRRTDAGVFVDGVFFVTSSNIDQKEMTLCLNLRDDKFEEIINPTLLLDYEAEKLRNRLKEIEAIKERRMKK